MEKMTVHRGLAELKRLDNAIDKAITEGVYITANKKSNIKIDGKTLDEHKKVIQGSYDKVVGLIDRRNRIKSAIVNSNASTIVEIAGVKMTVAEAIERKTSIQYDILFLQALKMQYSQAVGKVNKENEVLPTKLETYLQAILGDKGTAKPEEIELHTKTFLERNEFELIDPLELKKRMDQIQDSIDNFLAEVDAVLSESNAMTFIFDEEAQ